jgi:predicted nucleic acid-binding protein
VIVIDASAIAKYVLREGHWEQVRDHITPEPCSLDLALAGVSNAIWKHQVIYRRMRNYSTSLGVNSKRICWK